MRGVLPRIAAWNPENGVSLPLPFTRHFLDSLQKDTGQLSGGVTDFHYEGVARWRPNSNPTTKKPSEHYPKTVKQEKRLNLPT